VVNDENANSMGDLAEEDTLDEGEYASPNENDETVDEGGSEAESILIFLLFIDLGDIVGKSWSGTGLVPLLEVDVPEEVEEGAVRSRTPTLGLPNPPNPSVLPPPAAAAAA